MGQLLGPDFPSDIGLAVSGGGDSMAMLALAHNWARVWGVRLWVVTIDHGLRAESADEAAMVAEEVRLLGHKHCTLTWRWDGQGNVQARARDARFGLIARWRGTLAHVLFAHTADDVAETFLMRLSRQAGVEGLAEMQRSRIIDSAAGPALDPVDALGDMPPDDQHTSSETPGREGFILQRPCLEMGRAELRHYAGTLKVPWVEDPSNADPRFERVKMRQLLPTLEAAGLSQKALVSAARHMARASKALRLRAADRFLSIGTEGHVDGEPTGEILLDRDGFDQTDRETQLRLLSYAVSYISSQSYRPREAPLEALLDRVLAGGGATLHGCDVRMERHHLRIFREFNAVANCHLLLGSQAIGPALWDRRWALASSSDHTVGKTPLIARSLGEDGWAQLRDVPQGAPPYTSARSLPAIFAGDRLVHCGPMGFGVGTTRLWPMGRKGLSFHHFCLSH